MFYFFNKLSEQVLLKIVLVKYHSSLTYIFKTTCKQTINQTKWYLWPLLILVQDVFYTIRFTYIWNGKIQLYCLFFFPVDAEIIY